MIGERARSWLRTSIITLAFLAVPARAAAEARVVVAVTSAEPRTAQAVRARVGPELALRGFTVVDVESAPTDADPVTAILMRARTEQAVLGVLVRVDADGNARIDVVDRITGKRLERTSSIRVAHGPSEIALAAAELVDASLVELHLSARTAVGEVESPRDLPIPDMRPKHARWQADGVVAVLWPVRMSAPIVVASVALGVRPSRRLGLAAEATVPLHAMRNETAIATVQTFPFFVALRTDVDVLPRKSALRLDLQAALAGIALRIEVDAIPGASGHPQTTWSSAAIFGLALHKPVGRHGNVGGALRLVVPFEDLRIVVDGAPAQRLGGVWLGVGVSAAARW